MLDAVLEDANRLKARVGANDKIRLEQHMDGIRDLEHRLAILEDDPPQMDSCSMPVTPDADYPDIEGRPQLSARNRAMVDLVVMALACDQVRVFTDMFGHPVGNTLYPDATAGHLQVIEQLRLRVGLDLSAAFDLDEHRAIDDDVGGRRLAR